MLQPRHKLLVPGKYTAQSKYMSCIGLMRRWREGDRCHGSFLQSSVMWLESGLLLHKPASARKQVTASQKHGMNSTDEFLANFERLESRTAVTSGHRFSDISIPQGSSPGHRKQGKVNGAMGCCHSNGMDHLNYIAGL